MALLEDVIRRGTRGSQPAATAVATGTLYYVTDEGVTERSNGATWDDFSDTGAATDSDAIHDNVAGEIVAVADKATPTVNDHLLIEDAADLLTYRCEFWPKPENPAWTG